MSDLSNYWEKFKPVAEKFITGGETKCEDKETPDPICYAFCGVLFFWWLKEVIAVLTCTKDRRAGCEDGKERRPRGIIQGIGLLLHTFLLVLMYYHCKSCQGQRGLVKLAVIVVVWVTIAVLLTPECEEKETFDPIIAPIKVAGTASVELKGLFVLVQVAPDTSPAELVNNVGVITARDIEPAGGITITFRFDYSVSSNRALSRREKYGKNGSDANSILDALSKDRSRPGARRADELDVELDALARLGLKGTYVLVRVLEDAPGALLPYAPLISNIEPTILPSSPDGEPYLATLFLDLGQEIHACCTRADGEDDTICSAQSISNCLDFQSDDDFEEAYLLQESDVCPADGMCP